MVVVSQVKIPNALPFFSEPTLRTGQAGARGVEYHLATGTICDLLALIARPTAIFPHRLEDTKSRVDQHWDKKGIPHIVMFKKSAKTRSPVSIDKGKLIP
jgi:hypothetical protein